MQVTLTPHAEELLRQALARHPGRSPEELLEQLLDQGSRQSSEPVDPVWQCLQSIPGVRLPEHWPPRFETFEPIPVEGELVSEQLIRERR